MESERGVRGFPIREKDSPMKKTHTTVRKIATAFVAVLVAGACTAIRVPEPRTPPASLRLMQYVSAAEAWRTMQERAHAVGYAGYAVEMNGAESRVGDVLKFVPFNGLTWCPGDLGFQTRLVEVTAVFTEASVSVQYRIGAGHTTCKPSAGVRDAVEHWLPLDHAGG